jgi:catechol 2,3-dioxygenase-like lactoylglutathione lyase family enzyme
VSRYTAREDDHAASGRTLVEHVTLSVAGAPGAREFYRACMAVLGLREDEDNQGRASYGAAGEFGIYESAARFFESTHVAFAAPSAAVVDRFCEAALASGGTTVDRPRLRPEFGGSYSAYLRDPAGNLIEVICRSPESGD